MFMCNRVTGPFAYGLSSPQTHSSSHWLTHFSDTLLFLTHSSCFSFSLSLSLSLTLSFSLSHSLSHSLFLSLSLCHSLSLSLSLCLSLFLSLTLCLSLSHSLSVSLLLSLFFSLSSSLSLCLLSVVGTHEAEEACIEYRMRVSEKKAGEMRKRNRGLGGLVRNNLGNAPVDLDSSELRY